MKKKTLRQAALDELIKRKGLYKAVDDLIRNSHAYVPDIRITWEKEFDDLLERHTRGVYVGEETPFTQVSVVKKFFRELLERAITQAYNAGIKQGKEEFGLLEK